MFYVTDRANLGVCCPPVKVRLCFSFFFTPLAFFFASLARQVMFWVVFVCFLMCFSVTNIIRKVMSRLHWNDILWRGPTSHFNLFCTSPTMVSWNVNAVAYSKRRITHLRTTYSTGFELVTFRLLIDIFWHDTYSTYDTHENQRTNCCMPLWYHHLACLIFLSSAAVIMKTLIFLPDCKIQHYIHLCTKFVLVLAYEHIMIQIKNNTDVKYYML